MDGMIPFPALHGPDEHIDSEEILSRQAKVVHPTPGSKLAVLMSKVINLAKPMVPDHINERELYDATLNFSSTHVIAHYDHPAADGPGQCIVNIVAKGGGRLVFSTNDANERWQGAEISTGDVYLFWGDLRWHFEHQVLRVMKTRATQIGTTLENLRLVITLRFGRPTEEEMLIRRE